MIKIAGLKRVVGAMRSLRIAIWNSQVGFARQKATEVTNSGRAITVVRFPSRLRVWIAPESMSREGGDARWAANVCMTLLSAKR
jgi:hypothetical protein